MKSKFDKIGETHERTEKLRAKKEKMLAEQREFVPPPMPRGARPPPQTHD